MKGILLAGGKEMNPIITAMNKHLLPVYVLDEVWSCYEIMS